MRVRRAREWERQCTLSGRQDRAYRGGTDVRCAGQEQGGGGETISDSTVCAVVQRVIWGGDGGIDGSRVSRYDSDHIIFENDGTGDLSPRYAVCLRRI